MRILWRNTPRQRSIRNCGRACATRSKSDPRAAAARVARIFYRPSFGFDFRNASTAFYFHDLVAQKRRTLEFEICRGFLHLLLQLPEQFGPIEIAAGRLNNGGAD